MNQQMNLSKFFNFTPYDILYIYFGRYCLREIIFVRCHGFEDSIA